MVEGVFIQKLTRDQSHRAQRALQEVSKAILHPGALLACKTRNTFPDATLLSHWIEDSSSSKSPIDLKVGQMERACKRLLGSASISSETIAHTNWIVNSAAATRPITLKVEPFERAQKTALGSGLTLSRTLVGTLDPGTRTNWIANCEGNTCRIASKVGLLKWA